MPSRRLRALARHMAPPATAPTAIEVDPTTGIGYAELELPHRSVGKGATPERLAHLEKFGFVILDDFVDSPYIARMREDARRIVDEANSPYPHPVHTAGYIHRGVADGSSSAIRGVYHPAFRSPSFAEFFSSEEVLAFTKSWTGLEKEQLRFYPPHIFCSPNRDVEREWTPGGGGGWQ